MRKIKPKDDIPALRLYVRKFVPIHHLHHGEVATHAGYLGFVFMEGHGLYTWFAGAGVVILVAGWALYGMGAFDE